jgi:uncharacterized membrane protein YeiH
VTGSTSLRVLDLAGTFTFALNGGLIAIRFARLDVIAVATLAMITALGGGIVRDVLIGDLPPASFDDWRYIVVCIRRRARGVHRERATAEFTTLMLVVRYDLHAPSPRRVIPQDAHDKG